MAQEHILSLGKSDLYGKNPFCGQCDQMAGIFFQYLAIWNNENLPHSIT